MPAREDFPQGLFRSPFEPAAWLGNPHAQTLFPQWHRATGHALPRTRERLILSDGDCLDLDCHTPENVAPDAPLTLIIHGLSGSSDSHYVIGLQTALAGPGWPSVAMNCRGATGPNRQVRAYHAGASDDVIEVFQALAARSPQKIAIVGYSLGGSMALKTGVELAEHPQLLGIVAVSSPLHLAACASRLDRGFSRFYRRHLLGELTRMWRAKVTHFRAQGEQAQADRIEACLEQSPIRSFWEFDDRLMAPLHGFADVHDYYARCNPQQHLPELRVPTLVIHAEDDPFMDPSVIPAAHRLSPQVHFELSSRGGHVGFIGGTPRHPVYYLEARIPRFLQWLNAKAAA